MVRYLCGSRARWSTNRVKSAACCCLVTLAAFGAQVNGNPVLIAGWNPDDPATSADGRPALLTRFGRVDSVAIAPDGFPVIAGGQTIRKIGADGLVHTLLHDPNLYATLIIAFDASGNIYYPTGLGIARLTPSGTHTTIGGNGTGMAADGMPSSGAQLMVEGIAVSPSGDVIFSDGHTARIWRLDSAGVLHAVAGTDTPGTGGENGPAVSAQLEFPTSLAYDSAGALYIMDAHRILQVRTDGTLMRLTAPSLTQLGGALAVTPAGTAYFTLSPGYVIARLNADGSSTTIAGTMPGSFSNGCASGANPAVGDAKTAVFGFIPGLAVDPAGNVLALDQSNDSLRQINPQGQIRTLAGAPPRFSGDGGPALSATFSNLQSLAIDSAGNFFVADTGNNRIRKIDAGGVVHTIGGQNGPTADMIYSCSAAGPNYLHAPAALALDAAGTVYVADTLNHRVVKLAADGTPILFAGTGTAGYAPATAGVSALSTPLDSPRALGIDRDGNIWVGDNASRTLKISPAGVIVKTFPGMRTRSFSTDAQQNLYLTSNFISYQVLPGDQLVQLAGQGSGSSISTDGPDPVVAPDSSNDINLPSAITRDGGGNLFSLGYNIQWISPQCNSLNAPSSSTFILIYDAMWYAAESSQGDIYSSDSQGRIWRLPRASFSANDPPTPVFTNDAIVENDASQLIADLDEILPTGGFTSSPFRFIVSDKIAPGEIVKIGGQCIGPFTPVLAAFDANGRLPTSLGGAQVSIGGLPAPLVSAAEGMIVAIVPFGVPLNQSLSLTVSYNGVTISNAGDNLWVLNSTAYRPGVVRYLELDGASTAAAINQDGTLNSTAHPAPPGSILAFWATGLGQTNPAGVDGQVQNNIAAQYLTGVKVTVGGLPANVQYAGPAPGFAALSQINIQIPSVSSGAQPLQVLMGTNPFQQTVQVWVQ